jgi:prophage maintenance system killer protein
MQMAEIFGVNPPAISKHIQNIYTEKELGRKATSSKMELVQKEAGRSVKREVDIYNLDMLIAVGYRINSVVGTKFRQWATKTLKEYVTEGYAINKKIIAANYQQFQKTVEEVKKLLPAGKNVEPEGLTELIAAFADTWLSLEAYDRGALSSRGVTKKKVALTAEELTDNLTGLKTDLLKTKTVGEIFGQERSVGNVASIVGNIMQSFGGNPVYATVEEKAAHLLYFMVKNHPFVDGNKRSGAFAFVWFLRKAKLLNQANMNSTALTTLTLLVAESDPKDKEKVIGLILQLLRK